MTINPNPLTANTMINRRAFLSRATCAVAGSAAWLSGRFSTHSHAAKPDLSQWPSWFEADIPRLQALMAAGTLSSRELVQGYLNRITQLNPLLHAVIETNPEAIALATRLDSERRGGLIRGPLHGIPILLKDNIATADRMQTTAGSLALVGSRVPGDSPLVANLRRAGAVILGKANLGEWANFRGFIPAPPFNLFGWSARGGNTLNPYALDYSPWGSSSGSAVAAATNLCAAAVGTETDGSIVGPSNANLVVGLKPTLGLISQAGIIPIGHSQDTAGPIGRTVTDVAILLGAMQSPFGAVVGHPLPTSYTGFLHRGALQGARIGVDRRFFDQYDVYGVPGDADSLVLAQQALATMTALGATLVDTDTGDIFAYGGDEFTTLLFEFKVHMAEYLAGLTHTDLRTLADVIAFNQRNCPNELVYYGQELFEIADSTSGDLNDPVYIAARGNARQMARNGIDSALAQNDLDAIVAPHLTNSTAPAVSGYPNIAIPLGVRPGGRPAGLLMYGTFLQEPALLGFAYDLEQALQARSIPQFMGTPVEPTNAGICGSTRKPHVFTGKAHLPRGRIF